MLSNVQLFYIKNLLLLWRDTLLIQSLSLSLSSFNQNDDINENPNMLFNHLERLKIIFNQLGLLCQFKELLMRVKFVNSLWAAFFCVYVVEGHAEMGGGRYQKGCSRSCYYIIISYLHEAHTFSVYLWVHQEFNCYNLLSTIHELSQAESLAAQNRESQNFFFFF